MIKSFERISCDSQYHESLSFTLNHNNSGGRTGFELLPISPENIKATLQNVLKITSIKEGINKPEALKRHIKNIIYSKEAIEIKLCLPARPAGGPADKTEIKDGNEENLRPKMPPSIFGRRNDSIQKSSADAYDCLGEEAVLGKRKARCSVSLRTFSIILPNPIHGDKKHLDLPRLRSAQVSRRKHL